MAPDPSTGARREENFESDADVETSGEGRDAGTTSGERDAGTTSGERDGGTTSGEGRGAEMSRERRVVVETPHRAAHQHAEYRDAAASVVSREELDERLPRSAPDALRYEPGVYIQQTAHAQASPYIRGLTGQQVGLFFDGIRINNSTFRQGPNQYFFTIDARTIERIEVVRGSASTRWGSDALGGVILSTPIGPAMERGPKPWTVHGAAFTRVGTADAELGGRAQLEVVYDGRVGVFAGLGGRRVGQLQSGGRVDEPATGRPQNVPPAFADDGKTQLGTGFNEVTGDARLVFDATDQQRMVLGYYDYRQLDAPRTDKCPPPTAPEDECLTFDKQFRTLVYAAHELTGGPAAAHTARTTVSYQRQHESLDLDRGDPSFTRIFGRNTVHTMGVASRIATKRFVPAPWVDLGASYGVDLYYDHIRSDQSIEFEDTMIGTEEPRGQYIDGSDYLTSGVWAQGEVSFDETLHLHAGGRGAVVHAQADGQAQTGSAEVDQTWTSAVGNVGIAAHAVPWLQLLFNVDQGFRAPNLDDLTSRQQTGPGFQFENAELDPETSLTLEGGLQVRARWVDVDAWVYRTTIRNLIGRNRVTVDDCPSSDFGCSASQTLFRLENFSGVAKLFGAEGSLRIRLPLGLFTRATVSWARGEMPNPFGSAEQGNDRVPMSRVPPLNGTVELGWRAWFGLRLSGAVRWATLQDRLAPQDVFDLRIPRGGTPGYAVVDLRASYRLDHRVFFGVVVENLGDAAYRVHGSSLNGPGRSLVVESRFGF